MEKVREKFCILAKYFFRATRMEIFCYMVFQDNTLNMDGYYTYDSFIKFCRNCNYGYQTKRESGAEAPLSLSLSKNPIIKLRNTHPRLQKSKNISQKLANKGVSTPSLQAFSDSWQQI